MSERLLITGAAGFVGRHLLSRLLEVTPRAPIWAWRRAGASAVGIPADGVSWQEVDLLDRERVSDAIADAQPTAVYHLAGAAHVGRSWSDTTHTLAVNVLGTDHLLGALAESRRSCRVLVTGSALVYRAADEPLTESSPLDPGTPYGLSKLAQEMLALRVHREDGLPIVLARAFNHVGPGQAPTFFASSFARQIAAIERGAQEPVITVGNIEARRDLTDVRDTVRAYCALMASGDPGVPYNVCSGRAVAVGEVLRRLVARARVPVQVTVHPELLRANDTPLVVGSCARLRARTGWRPEIPLDRTLDDLLAWWRERLTP